MRVYINGDLKRREAKLLYKKTLYGDDYTGSGSDSSGSGSSGAEFDEVNAEDYLGDVDFENEDNQEGVKVIKKLSLNVNYAFFKKLNKFQM